MSFAGALALALAAAPASAASYDPDLTWRTITTEHFDIHFHQGEEALAESFSGMVEEVYDELTADLRWQPRRRTQLVLVDRTDQANGYAMTTPWNTIVIYVTAPQEDSSLGLYEDWSRTIFTHELTHILHLDTNHGLVRLARRVVGRVASTNQLSPWWMTEGFATYQETEHTPGGRGRSPYVDMILRTSVVEGDFPPLGNLDGLQPDPPGGNLRYLFGEDFIRYVADHHGEDVWTKWIHTYGSGVPYVLPSRRVFGKRLVPLYNEWRADMNLRFEGQADDLRAIGLREGRVASPPESSCSSPSFSPDGEKLIWSCHDVREGASIWLADGMGYGGEVLVPKVGAKNFTWRRDSEAFVYASTHVVNRFNTWSDIYLWTLDGDRPTALTRGARARDPDFSPDGRELYVVTNKVQQNQLQRMTVDRILEPVLTPEDDTQLSTPRWSPDGRVVALSVWQDGRRDLWLYSPEGKPLRRLTMDAEIDRDPEWSADGRWLYFSSDRSDVPNVYGIEIETERLWQLTNVLTGATAPSASPDGRWLAYQQYTHDGWEIRILDRHESEPIDRGLLPRPVDHHAPIATLTAPVDAPVAPAEVTWVGEPVRRGFVADAPLGLAQAPGEGVDTFEQAEVEGVFGEEQAFPFTIEPHRYRAIDTLAPSFWLPYFQLTPYSARALKTVNLGSAEEPFYPSVQATAFTGGSDTLRHLSWAGQANYRNDANFFGGSGSVVVNRWLPVYAAGFSRSAVPFLPIQLTTDEPVGEDGEPVLVDSGQRYWENRTTGTVSVTYPYTHRTYVFGRYSLTNRAPLDPLPADAYLPGIPVRGTIGSLAGGWRYAYGEGSAYQISPENTRIFSLVGGLLHPFLGTSILQDTGERKGLTQVQLTSEIREYRRVPWLPNHVVAMRLAGGVTVGPTDFQGNYVLGGNYGDAAFYSTPDEFRMVRGHPLGADIGDMYWLGGLEYRAPILRIDRGVGTIPLFVRYVSGAVFVDAGNAFVDAPRSLGDLSDGALVGVGAELRLSFVAGWALGTTTRIGYAVGLDPAGYKLGDPGAFYLLGGSSF